MLNKQPNRVQYKGFLSDNQKSAIINGYFVANSQQIGKKNVRSSKTKISFLRNESYIFLDNRERPCPAIVGAMYWMLSITQHLCAPTIQLHHQEVLLRK